MNYPNPIIEKFSSYNFSKKYIDISILSALETSSEMLAFLLTYASRASKVKDNFSSAYIRNGGCINVNLESEKLGNTFSLLIYDNQYILSVKFCHPYYLKSMDDTFWKDVSSLNEYGQFKFRQHAVTSSNTAIAINKALGQYKSSNIFEIIKNYILLEDSGGTVDFGSLEVSWSLSEEADTLVQNIIEAFSKIHKINYLLYRKHYLNTR